MSRLVNHNAFITAMAGRSLAISSFISSSVTHRVMNSAPRNPLAETLPTERRVAEGLGDITVDIGNLGKGKLSGVVSYLVTNRTVGSYWRRKKRVKLRHVI
ncbi:hypothetical protein [Desulfitobacterium sp. LBE]|uniref:hypothetical protein n=1 Tax=Desulfitobacterium sp. LBE TaxID=884086 RepID=UPI001A9B6852|nr:hypothetical protein [Desulfitobacterium sp. LBE]